jgi:hypothetical protein
MVWFHPAAVEHRRKLFTRPDSARFLRHDAHRFGRPKPSEKSWAARMVEQIRADEEEVARAAEIAAFEAGHRALRRELAELKFELAWRALCRKYGFNPDQPRDELGRWTDAGGASQSDSSDDPAESDAQPESDREVLSDGTPDPIRPGAQYAQSRVQVHESALTGEEDIDKTTYALAKRLENIVNALPEGSGAAYGTLVHETLKLSLQLFPLPGVKVEPTFGGTGTYGSAGSVRPDISLENLVGDTRAFYDYKTGDAAVGPSYPDRVRGAAGVGPSVYFIEISYPRGVSRKSRCPISFGGTTNVC